MFQEPDQDRLDYLRNRLETLDNTCNDMQEVMNDIHGTDYSKRFWKLLLLDHVNQSIQRFDKYSSKSTKGGDLDSGRFIDKLTGQLIATYRKNQYRRNFNKLGRLLKSNKNLIHGFRYPQLGEKEIGPLIPNIDFAGVPLKDFSVKEKAEKVAEKLTVKLHQYIVETLPPLLLENFKWAYDKIELFKPEIKEFHIANFRTLFIKMVVGKYINNGAKLYFYQHGGGYGEKEFHLSHPFQNDMGDEFRSFGWQINSKDNPYTAKYRFSYFKDMYNKSRGNDFDIFLGFPKIKANNVDFYQKESEDFFSVLDPNKYNKIIARPHPFKKWENQGRKLSFITDTRVSIDSARKDIAKVVSKTKLAIMFQHPTTNFLECHYVGHPIMSILSNDNPSDIIRPYYAFFIENGVFHPNMKSLVKFLNSIDVEEWWADLTKKEMYKEYKNKFVKEEL